MEELDLKILLQMFGKQKKQIICIILLFMTIGVIYTMFFVTPVYSSSTSLILSTSENNSTNLGISTTTATELNVNSKLVSTYTELVKSKKILGKVISNLNLNITEDALKKKVSVQPVEDADFIKITVVNPNAEQAAQIANEIANVFIEDGVKQYYKMDNVQVVDKAEPSLRPSNINKKRDILIFMNTNQNAKTILITSAFANEGKSWISSNLSIAFAQTGKKVLLIDADMRKGRQSSIFNISPLPGLSNYLSNSCNNTELNLEEEIIKYLRNSYVENLFVMPSGNIPPNPSELLNLPQMKDLLEKVKRMCDIIIIDGTPCQLVADSLIISGIVENTIIVTASEETKKDGLKRIVTNIENIGGKISGIVLNKVPIVSKDYQETYYYSSHKTKK